MPESSSRPAVLVTGASRGIGRAIARTLAAHGFDVFAAVRSAAAAADVTSEGGGGITPLLLEVTDANSIRAAASTLAAALGDRGLAALVNNAGIAPFGPVEQMPMPVFEQAFRVNVFGVVALTQALLPLLRTARGRIVNVSSINGRLSFPFAGAYSATKFALEAVSDALRVELAPFGIHVVVIQPGAFNTSIRADGMRSWGQSGEAQAAESAGLYAGPWAALSNMIATMDAIAPPVQPVADAVLESLIADVPKSRYPVGEDWSQLAPLIAMPDHDRDAALLGMVSGAAPGS